MLFEKKRPSLQRVLHFFEQISAVPRQSFVTAPIADYLCRFAKERGLLYLRDGADNVIIKKAASIGAEGLPAVLLQAHTDMVLVKKETEQADALPQGILLKREGDTLRAQGSSLGADDGIGMAYILAILDDATLAHPMLEALFTSNEEVGLLGASALDGRVLTARMLINLDSDEEGIFTAGCAGGSSATLTLPLPQDEMRFCYTLTLSGLPGGHSGTEIHKGIGNAILLLCAFLSQLSEGKKLLLSEISGGEASNAIPCFASARIHCSIGEEEILSLANRFLKNQAVRLGNASFTIEPAGELPCLTAEKSRALLSFILSLPSGILAMEEHLRTMPKTSLNLGKIERTQKGLSLYYALRSSDDKNRQALEEHLLERTVHFGGKAKIDGEYPSWSFRENSPLRETCLAVYRKRYGREATVATVHAGLECGVLAAKLAGLDAISFGPNNRDIHTVDEALSLRSAEEVYGYLCELLKALCKRP